MKFKPIYIYPLLFVVVILGIVILSIEGDNSEGNGENISSQSMPQDEVHQGLSIPGEDAPSSSNVLDRVKQQMEMLEKQINDNPNDTAKMRQYADMLTAGHQSEKAINYLQMILNIDPNRQDVLLSLTYNFYKLGNFDKATELTNRVLEIDPEKLEAKYNLGVLAAAKGDSESARKIWQKLIDDYPGTNVADLAERSLNSL